MSIKLEKAWLTTVKTMKLVVPYTYRPSCDEQTWVITRLLKDPDISWYHSVNP